MRKSIKETCPFCQNNGYIFPTQAHGGISCSDIGHGLLTVSAEYNRIDMAVDYCPICGRPLNGQNRHHQTRKDYNHKQQK